jgi:uncharacterized protein
MDDAPQTNPADDQAATPPQLDAVEARILGCLIEKAAITPDVYPLTLNSVVAACNQKTSREPVMNLELGAVGHALRTMTDRGLVKPDPFAQRVPRYTHCFDTIYGVTARQRAALCVMLLRGPQTLNEVFTRCERLTEFPSIEDVRDTLDRLIERTPALVVRLPHGGGRREDRYMHLLGGAVDIDSFVESAPMPTAFTRVSVDAELHERVTRLEAEVVALKEQIAKLEQER